MRVGWQVGFAGALTNISLLSQTHMSTVMCRFLVGWLELKLLINDGPGQSVVGSLIDVRARVVTHYIVAKVRGMTAWWRWQLRESGRSEDPTLYVEGSRVSSGKLAQVSCFR